MKKNGPKHILCVHFCPLSIPSISLTAKVNTPIAKWLWLQGSLKPHKQKVHPSFSQACQPSALSQATHCQTRCAGTLLSPWIREQDMVSLGLHISFAGFRVSQTDFHFTGQVGRGDRTTLSSQRNVISPLQTTTKKCSCFLMKNRSPPHLPSRGMFFPWKWQIGGDKAEQGGWSSHRVFPFELRHFFRTAFMGPMMFHHFSSYTCKENHLFALCLPQDLPCLSLSCFT